MFGDKIAMVAGFNLCTFRPLKRRVPHGTAISACFRTAISACFRNAASCRTAVSACFGTPIGACFRTAISVFLGAFSEKLLKATIPSSCLSVCPCFRTEQLRFDWINCRKILQPVF